jgi:hypothetical protein
MYDILSLTNSPLLHVIEKKGLSNFHVTSKIHMCGNRDSSVGIATGEKLDSQGSILGKGSGFSLPHNVRIVSRALPASYALGIENFSPK